jgi:hypothetical protein
VYQGQHPGVPDAPGQLYPQEDDGCVQEPRGYARKLELLLNRAKMPLKKCGAFLCPNFAHFTPFSGCFLVSEVCFLHLNVLLSCF